MYTESNTHFFQVVRQVMPGTRTSGKGQVITQGLLKVNNCRMDLPGPTTSVGTRTDYSVGPWDYPTCVARYLMA
jgi:hypothetical protein